MRGVVAGSGGFAATGATRGNCDGSKRSLVYTGAGREVGGIDCVEVATCAPAMYISLLIYILPPGGGASKWAEILRPVIGQVGAGPAVERSDKRVESRFKKHGFNNDVDPASVAETPEKHIPSPARGHMNVYVRRFFVPRYGPDSDDFTAVGEPAPHRLGRQFHVLRPRHETPLAERPEHEYVPVAYVLFNYKFL